MRKCGREFGLDRRALLRLGVCAGLGAGLFGLGRPSAALAAEEKVGETRGKEEEVSANEDLMREHGVIVRLLLVYEEAARRLRAGDGGVAKTLGAAADVVRRFAGEYHEKTEETQVFPRLEKSEDYALLVGVLQAQHEAGRGVTGRILALTRNEPDQAGREELVRQIESFTRMYYPHLAREDTVLFPAFRASMPKAEYEKLGERFEEAEDQILGKGGFENILAQTAAIEKELGIDDLSLFTPVASAAGAARGSRVGGSAWPGGRGTRRRSASASARQGFGTA